MKSEPMRGVIAPILTPFNDNGMIAEDLYISHAKSLLNDGCVGLAPFGTTGEALSVGIEERAVMLDTMISAGIDPALLIPGTGLTNLPDTIRLTRQAVELGCAGALILPPFYYKSPSEAGLFTYFARLIEAIGANELRVYLYHIPQVAGVGIPVSLAAHLKHEFPEQIVGIKDSSGDWDNTRLLLEIDGLIVYPGAELPLIEAIELGAPGCISATANINGAAIGEVAALMHAGEKERAVAKMQGVKKFRLTMQEYAPIPAQKWLLADSTGDDRWLNVRPPLEPLAQTRGQALKQELGWR